MVSGTATLNSTGSSVTAKGGTNGSEIFDNSSLWTKGGEVEIINFTINFTGPDAITGANITVPTNGYNIRFWNVSINATSISDPGINYTRWIFYNRSGSVLSMENLTSSYNFTHGFKVPLNIWLNATAANGTEGVFDWNFTVYDNSTNATIAPSEMHFKTYVDGMPPRLYNINITDGTNTLIASSGQLNNTKYLLTGVNLTVYATINDSTFDVNSSVMLIYNMSGPATKATGRVIMMNITNYLRGTPYLVSAIIPAGTANDTNFTNFLLVANDSFNQVYTTSGTFNYTIDGANPTVTVTPPSSTTIDTSASITYKCASSDASPVTLLWTLTKPNSQTITKTTTSVTFTGADTQGAGTYSLTCKITDEVGHEVTSATYQFTAHLTSSTTTGGAAGGATGGDSGTVAEVKVDHNLAKETDATVEVSKKEGQSTTISLDSKTSHTVKFKKITASTVTLVIQSDPIEVTLNVGESKQVDLDGDGTNELEVSLESISGGAAKVVMKKIAQTATEKVAPAPSETTPTETTPGEPTPTTTGGTTTAAGKSSLTWLWILIIVVIVVAIVAVIMKKKNK
ncbi:hypothetical protein HYT57_04135 [Candidatus Woesearchaeota archaeon]|nr:hypothetical protein [Candidatus Woesearchaeota archaeon]